MWLVAYEIPDDRRRARVAKVLLRFGRRVQYSVFLADRGPVEAIAHAIERVVDRSADDVRIQPLCATYHGKVVLLGPGGRAPRAAAGYRLM